MWASPLADTNELNSLFQCYIRIPWNKYIYFYSTMPWTNLKINFSDGENLLYVARHERKSHFHSSSFIYSEIWCSSFLIKLHRRWSKRWITKQTKKLSLAWYIYGGVFIGFTQCQINFIYTSTSYMITLLYVAGSNIEHRHLISDWRAILLAIKLILSYESNKLTLSALKVLNLPRVHSRSKLSRNLLEVLVSTEMWVSNVVWNGLELVYSRGFLAQYGLYTSSYRRKKKALYREWI